MTAQLYPQWKQAVENFLSMSPQPGQVIPKEWFWEAFGIGKPITAEDQQKASLEFMTSMENFKTELLEEHLIDLGNVRGEGYKIIPPKDQTREALVTRTRNISHELRKMSKSIAFVNVGQLTDEERKVHADGAAKAATIRSMFDRRKLLGRG